MLPIQIGLTGGVGMGKSSVALALADHGAQIVSGDELGRIALEESPELLAAVRRRFGDDVFLADGRLRRGALGKSVFASREHTRWLTALTFPRIYRLWKDAVRRAPGEVIVFDAALIMEWGIEGDFDFLVVVTAPENLVRERLERAGKLTPAEATTRQERQIAAAEKAGRADQVISNHGSLADLRRQVDEFWQNVVESKLAMRREQRNAAQE